MARSQLVSTEKAKYLFLTSAKLLRICGWGCTAHLSLRFFVDHHNHDVPILGSRDPQGEDLAVSFEAGERKRFTGSTCGWLIEITSPEREPGGGLVDF